MARSLALLILVVSAASFAQEAAPDTPPPDTRPSDVPLDLPPPSVAPVPAAAPPIVQPRGIFVGEKWRYQHHSAWGGLGLRILADLISMPSSVVNWDAADAAMAALVVTTTVT